MPALPKAYQYLAAQHDLAVDEALVAASKDLEGPLLAAAAEVLLRRGQPNGLLAVIEQFHRLPANLAPLVLERVAALGPVLRMAVRGHDVQTRLNSLDVADQLGLESLAYLFDLGLSDPHPHVRERAGALLRRMAQRLLNEHPMLCGRTESPAAPARPAAPDGDTGTATLDPIARLALRRTQFLDALLPAGERYDTHLRPEVIEACVWFEPYLGERFWQLLRQPRSRIARLVADLMLSSNDPAAAIFTLQATGIPGMRAAATKAIAERRDPGWFRTAVRGVSIWQGWGRVRRSWVGIKSFACLQSLKQGDWLHLAGCEALPALVSASGIGSDWKQTLMARILEHGTPPVRRQVLFEACRASDWGPDLLRSVLNSSNDRAEVRIAAHGLLQAGHEALTGDLVKRLRTPDDPSTADLVPLAADLLFWRLWDCFDTMREESRVALLSEIRGFGSLLRTRLRVKMAGASVSHRLRAVRMAGMLGMVDDLWPDMLAAAQDPHGRMRSAAIRFCGRSRHEALRRQVRLALDDPDARVQANAIEAIEEANWPDRVPLLLPKLRAADNRVRANAARALVGTASREAFEALSAMLDDPRAEYRLTAIWTIRTTDPAPWAEELARLSEHDPVLTVRRHARLALSGPRSQSLLAAAQGSHT